MLASGTLNASTDGTLAVMSIYERALSLLPDGVLIVDSSGSVIFANSAFYKIWAIPEHLSKMASESSLLVHAAQQLEDASEFVANVSRTNSSTKSSEDEISLKNGQVLKRRSIPFDDNGHRVGRIWIFSDVTEARRAFVDHLTGLPNRRAYAKAYSRSILAPADGLYTAFALMDIDNFKSFNDCYGHPAGDDVLRELGGLLEKQLSDDDEALRIGGEEFAVICRRRSRENAISALEKLRQAILLKAIPHEGNSPHAVVSASFGISVFKEPQDPQELFERTDQALYLAKEQGRNQIVIADMN